MHSGSGTLLRYASALATVTRKPLNIFNIRAKRDKPGLRPQHLMALRACSALSCGRLEGDQVGSQEITYRPGNGVKGGTFEWDIGTAGSATMLAFALLAPALYAKTACRFTITGGLFQDFAPTAFHMRQVLLPVLRSMGADVELDIIRPGYVPKGGGRLQMTVKPLSAALKPLRKTEQGNVMEIRGIALASHLKKEEVSERMADRCREILMKRGYQATDSASARLERRPKRRRTGSLGKDRHGLHSGIGSGRQARKKIGSDSRVRLQNPSGRFEVRGHNRPASGGSIDPLCRPG